jgi:hypothetical protein
MPDHAEHNGNAWSSRAKWAFAVFAIIGAFFLLAEHRAHVLAFLPWLILLACPLMHKFMHGGHGGHGCDHGGGNHAQGRNGGSSRAQAEDPWAGVAGESHLHHGNRP